MVSARIRVRNDVARPRVAGMLGLALACSFACDPARATEVGGACDIPPATLEADGARIRTVTIDNRNIFDLSQPEDDNRLFRLLNDLHVRTRPEVIRRQLLFAEGDVFDQRLLEESGRILRATPYLYEATVAVVGCDAGHVDVLVRTRDVWTLKLGVSLSRSGGESRSGLDLEEENLLGRGGAIRYVRRIDEERTSTEVGYRDANLRGRRISLDASLADNSDGHVVAFSLVRPFYALDTRRAMGGSALDEKRNDSVYALGDEIGEFRHDIESYNVFMGRSDGWSDGWVRRWLTGVVYDRHRFEAIDERLDPALVPDYRRLVYPYIEYQLLEDDYQVASNLDQIYRQEDVRLGAEIGIRLGYSATALGADRNALIFWSGARWAHGDPSRHFWRYNAYASGRVEGSELRNAMFGGTARWYLRQSERRLLFAAVRADVGEALDRDNPLEIGGDDGLRGYPLRYQRGERRAQFTIEQRYFTDYYLWRLFRVGGAVFFDAGRVWGEDPFGSENLGLLRDVGFGLRLSSTRSSIGKMIHIDFAFPLDGDSSIDSFQFLVEGKRSF